MGTFKMSFLQTEIISHSRKVCSLYKNADVKDLRLAQKLLDDGEKELFNYMHYQPRKFPLSPGGVAYEREVNPPDWVLDYWHPMEKAAYPDYFARREQRKQYIEWWENLWK